MSADPEQRSLAQTRIRTFWLTTLALIAFAANSLLCRLALAQPSIDAASFSLIRLTSGAVSLWLILKFSKQGIEAKPKGNWVSAGFLFLYVAGFSYAYLSLSASTGALILFGTVQVAMLFASLYAGERPRPAEWVGWLLALTGLIYLVLPGLTTPTAAGFIAMALAGIGWGYYSLRGRGVTAPLAETAGNFARATPFAVLFFFYWAPQHMNFSTTGILAAIISGAVTSGAGYAIWYAALRALSATQAATVQLAVPVMTAAGGVIFLSEAITLRLLSAGVLILGGIGFSLHYQRNSGQTR